MQHEKTKDLAMTALMTALIFTATYIIKIPNPATGGYTHMGDCMIFLGVMVLGRKHGALAGGLGGALSDLLSGAAVWVLPTFFIKYAMGWIMGLLLEKSRLKNRLIAAGTGGVFQIIAYTLVKIPLTGVVPAIASVARICMQTVIGLVLFTVLSAMLSRTEMLSFFEEKRI
ncbi:ECF transporter S component [[Clostridium] innocuum]|nr:ECF transporter S component [[Clostridium] innocuum]